MVARREGAVGCLKPQSHLSGELGEEVRGSEPGLRPAGEESRFSSGRRESLRGLAWPGGSRGSRARGGGKRRTAEEGRRVGGRRGSRGRRASPCAAQARAVLGGGGRLWEEVTCVRGGGFLRLQSRESGWRLERPRGCWHCGGHWWPARLGGSGRAKDGAQVELPAGQSRRRRQTSCRGRLGVTARGLSTVRWTVNTEQPHP